MVGVAFVSHMPAQFVNWGRFTQLDGQMLLPVAALLYLALLQPAPVGQRASRIGLLFLVVLTFVGLFFAHYRVFLFGVLLAATLWLWAMWRPHPPQSRARLLGETLMVTLLGVLLLAPWLWRLAQGFGGSFATTMVSGYEEEQYGAYYGFDPKELVNFGMHAPLWGAALLAALWGVWRRNGVVIALLLWLAGCFVGANLHYLNVTPLYSNTIVILALYLPLAGLIGYGAGEVLRWVGGRWPQIGGWRSWAVAWMLLVWGLLFAPAGGPPDDHAPATLCQRRQRRVSCFHQRTFARLARRAGC
jgi:hypothetical protein